MYRNQGMPVLQSDGGQDVKILAEKEEPVADTTNISLANIVPMYPAEGNVQGPGQSSHPLGEEVVATPRELASHIVTTEEDFRATSSESWFKRGKPNQFNIMLELFLSTGALVFKDSHGKVWAFIEENGIRKSVPLGGSQFYSRCLKLYHDKTGEPVGKETVDKVGALLSNTPLTYELFNRFAQQDGRIYIDLGNDTWDVVEITGQDYRVAFLDRPLFCRQDHQKSLPVPEKSGDVHKILDFLPIKDEQAKLLILVWICSVPLAAIPRPGIILYGDHGAGKTSVTEFLRGVLDPSSVLTLGRPSNDDSFTQQMDHHAIISLDNVQNLPQTVSDGICRAVSGGGHAKRVLYTTDDDFCYRYMRTFIINGITSAASSPDLLDRSILIELQRISIDERLEIETLKRKYDESRGLIFSGICDTLAKAISIRANQDLPSKLPRMADWCRWGMCIAEALGYGQEEFYQAYVANCRLQHYEVITNEPICQALMSFMDAKKEKHWKGTAAQLYAELTTLAKAEDLKDNAWPRAANHFSRRLNTVRHSLEAIGYRVRDKKTHGTKLLLVDKV